MLRKIPLVGWDNPEGVAVLADGQIAIADERKHDMTLVSVDASTASLTYADHPHHDLGKSANSNKGFEAIAWDPVRQRLLLGEERPPKLYARAPMAKARSKAKSRLCPATSSMCAISPPCGSIPARAICWSCRLIPTCCWNWTKGQTGQLHDVARRFQRLEAHHSARRGRGDG